MALIKTLNEVKAVLPKLVSNLSDVSLLPNFDTAEIKYLVPIIGMDLYNDLLTKYTADTLTADQRVLLKHIQLLIAANAFRDEMIINQVMWTDQGLRTMSTQDMGKPVGWEFKELKNFFIDKSLDAEEVLLTYLWSKKADYALWTASNEYKQFAELLIRTGTDFKNQYRSLFQPMRTYYQLQPVVADVQELYLEAAIGEDLLKYLRDNSDPTPDENTGIKLLKKALAYLAIKHACMQLPIRISSAGLTVNSMLSDREDPNDAGRQGADAAAIEKLLKDSDREGQNFLSKARYHLYAIYTAAGTTADFNTAYEKGPLKGYVPPGDRTSGNEDRKIFVL
jgi:hypothetical protein